MRLIFLQKIERLFVVGFLTISGTIISFLGGDGRLRIPNAVQLGDISPFLNAFKHNLLIMWPCNHLTLRHVNITHFYNENNIDGGDNIEKIIKILYNMTLSRVMTSSRRGLQ